MPAQLRTLSCSLAIMLAACGGGGGNAKAPAQPAAAAGEGASSAADGGGGKGGSSAGSSAGGGKSAGSMGSSTASAGTGGISAANGGSGGSSAGAPAGGSTSAAGSGGRAAPAPTECNGKPLPPRAIAQPGPFKIGPEAAGLAPYWPTDAWKNEMPDKLGFDPTKLMAAVDFKTQYSNTQAVLVVRHGYVAAEKYSAGFSADMQHESYSMAKSFSSGLIGIAIGEGKIPGLDVKLCMYYPMQWDCSDTSDPRSRITLDNAMNLMTGLEWHEDWRSTATGTNDGYTTSLDGVLMRKSAEEPGVTKRYSTGDPALLSGVIQQTTGMTALAYAQQQIFAVIGTPNIKWNADAEGRTTTFAGLSASAREYAKYGYLYLNRGQWDGKQVVPSDWVDFTTQAKHPCDDWNQYLWHVNPPMRLGKQDPACPSLWCPPTEIANLPPDGFFAEGINGQFVFVIPSADLVIVRLANDSMGSEHWDEFAEGFLGAMLDAIQ